MMTALDCSTADACWNAIVARNPDADGAFLYGVQTTGVYCRPVCASRLPRRENVRFFDTWAAAEQSGFRPCKRCQPRAAAPHESHLTTITQLCQQIDQRIAGSERSLSLAELATMAGLSPFHLQRVFKAIVGLSPKQYELARQAMWVRQHLPTAPSVTEAICQAGLNMSSFYNTATNLLGMEPMRYQKGGCGVTLRYAVRPCDLGWVLVAATDRGICAIYLADTATAAIAQLQTRLPNAQIAADDPSFEAWVDAVITVVEAPAHAVPLPLDIQGTVFQQQVWQALQAIPPGQTTSYSDIAQALGKPKAVRAVARACAANELAVAIPCHRVVGRHGALTGYRWGLDRKQALLTKEADLSAQSPSCADQ